MNNFISIIIPIYNAEQYLYDCLNSVLNQTYSGFEVILINDGSTDSSGKICDEYALEDTRVKVFHKENGGVSAARNLGISKSKGDWIAFVDSDDRILPQFLEELIGHVDPDTDAVMQGFKRINKDKEILVDCGNHILMREINNAFLFEELRIFDFGFVASKLYKKSIVDNFSILFPEQTSHAEDLIFFLKYLFYSKKIRIQQIHNYEYFNRGDSLTSTFQKPEVYYYQYNLLKEVLKEKYPEVYEDLHKNSKKIFKSLGQIQFATLLKFLKSIYFHKYNKNDRINAMKLLQKDDFFIILLYFQQIKNPFLKIAYKLIIKCKFIQGDFVLYNYYTLVNKVRK
ncbi:glycosyltransferase family 2 protein [Kaistella sp.]|uniref:glycosyltransferase family 2 protein n=1 Tax=Kaistella sp. TaxID=2782235 RepID=UPI002F94FEBE